MNPMTLGEIVAHFSNALRSAGLDSEDPIVPDGALHRFRVGGDKPNRRNGWYVLYADGVPAGEFGCWKRGIKETWHADIGRALTDAERTESRARIEAMQLARDADLLRVREAARAKAEKLWAKANPRPSVKHPYLVRKRVNAHGIRQLRDRLLVPLRDPSRQLHGIQWISPDGSKKFGEGTATVGHYHAIGKPGSVLLISEGYATGVTVHEATGHAVAIAFSAGNLRPVAEAMRAKFPELRIIIAADNDHRAEVNRGLVDARGCEFDWRGGRSPGFQIRGHGQGLERFRRGAWPGGSTGRVSRVEGF